MCKLVKASNAATDLETNHQKVGSGGGDHARILMYVCRHLCVYLYIHAIKMYIHICAYIYANTYVYTYICVDKMWAMKYPKKQPTAADVKTPRSSGVL